MCLLEKAISEDLPHIFLCHPLFLYEIIDNMRCLINDYAMLTFDDVDTKKI